MVIVSRGNRGLGRANACYTSRFPRMLRPFPKLVVLLALPPLLTAVCAAQQDAQPLWQAPAAEFVQAILARGGAPSAITISFENLSSLGQAEQDAVKNTVLNELQRAGVQLVKAELALADVQITFSEDWQGYVWTAAIKQSSGTRFVIKKVARPQKTAASALPALTIRKTLVWQQDGTILDFLQDNQNLVVLEPEQVSLYINDAGQWRLRQTLAVNHDQPWPRDLRGRLRLEGAQLTAFLPGTKCSGALLSGSLQCGPADDPWQIAQDSLAAFYSPTRNFFTGVLAGQNAGDSVLPFFSGAAWQNGDRRVWVFTGTDGRTRLYVNTLANPAAIFTGWGGSIAALHSNCGSGWQVLVSSPADVTQPDAVQAVDVSSRDAAPVSTPVEFAGPVLALWPGPNGQSANAVVKSLATGKYEAHTLTVTCNQ